MVIKQDLCFGPKKDYVNRKTNHADSKDHVARTVAKKSWTRKEAVTGRKLISQ